MTSELRDLNQGSLLDGWEEGSLESEALGPWPGAVRLVRLCTACEWGRWISGLGQTSLLGGDWVHSFGNLLSSRLPCPAVLISPSYFFYII